VNGGGRGGESMGKKKGGKEKNLELLRKTKPTG